MEAGAGSPESGELESRVLTVGVNAGNVQGAGGSGRIGELVGGRWFTKGKISAIF